MTLEEIFSIYNGSNGDNTKALYVKLATFGPAGIVALNLFRACKCSERAKAYRGRRYTDEAYRRKEWSMGLLCEALEKDAAALGIVWGWGLDDETPKYPHVLYIETPEGQVSFHANARGKGPDYGRPWDGVGKQAPNRICAWIEKIMATNQASEAAE